MQPRFQSAALREFDFLNSEERELPPRVGPLILPSALPPIPTPALPPEHPVPPSPQPVVEFPEDEVHRHTTHSFQNLTQKKYFFTQLVRININISYSTVFIFRKIFCWNNFDNKSTTYSIFHIFFLKERELITFKLIFLVLCCSYCLFLFYALLHI